MRYKRTMHAMQFKDALKKRRGINRAARHVQMGREAGRIKQIGFSGNPCDIGLVEETLARISEGRPRERLKSLLKLCEFYNQHKGGLNDRDGV